MARGGEKVIAGALDPAAARELLARHNTLTLATHGAEGAWAASLFYASDDELNLYFVSDERTRHAREVAANPDVAVTVNADSEGWNDVLGLQMAGRVTLLAGPPRDAALACYLAKFAEIRALFEAPKDDNEALIAKRLKAAGFYCFAPDYIRLIDNARGFGFKLEWRR